MDNPSYLKVPLRTWQIRAVALSAAAGWIHILAAPSHLNVWIGYGMFFISAAIAQILYAVLLGIEPPKREYFWAGIIGNAAIMGLWIVTRTIGIPFLGPEAGVVEPVGLLDSFSKLIEVTLIVHLAVLLRAYPALDKQPLFQ